MLTDTLARLWAWIVAHPEFTAIVLLPLVGAVLNAIDGAVAKRFPRLAGVVAALFPHVRHAIETAQGKRLGTSDPPPAAEPKS